MPIKNGIQVFEEVKKFYKYQSDNVGFVIQEPTYVFLTAYATKMFIDRVHNLGVQHVFEKPMAFEELKRLLKQS